MEKKGYKVNVLPTLNNYFQILERLCPPLTQHALSRSESKKKGLSGRITLHFMNLGYWNCGIGSERWCYPPNYHFDPIGGPKRDHSSLKIGCKIF